MPAIPESVAPGNEVICAIQNVIRKEEEGRDCTYYFGELYISKETIYHIVYSRWGPMERTASSRTRLPWLISLFDLGFEKKIKERAQEIIKKSYGFNVKERLENNKWSTSYSRLDLVNIYHVEKNHSLYFLWSDGRKQEFRLLDPFSQDIILAITTNKSIYDVAADPLGIMFQLSPRKFLEVISKSDDNRIALDDLIVERVTNDANYITSLSFALVNMDPNNQLDACGNIARFFSPISIRISNELSKIKLDKLKSTLSVIFFIAGCTAIIIFFLMHKSFGLYLIPYVIIGIAINFLIPKLIYNLYLLRKNIKNLQKHLLSASCLRIG